MSAIHTELGFSDFLAEGRDIACGRIQYGKSLPDCLAPTAKDLATAIRNQGPLDDITPQQLLVFAFADLWEREAY